MFDWLVVRDDRRDVLVEAVKRVWRGGQALVADVDFPHKKKPRRIAFAWPAPGVGARRAPRWPELLADWHEVNDDDPLCPVDALAVAAEEVSGLGADALCVHGGPGLAHATVIWYEKGAVESYEHVGKSTVAWTPNKLGRPFDGSAAQTAAALGRKLVGVDEDEVNVLERVANMNRAVGEVLLVRAFTRILDMDPPPIDELAGLVATANPQRFTVA